MTDKPPKRMGRPTKPPVPGERVPLGLRVTAEIRTKLEEAAVKSGRSLSQEAEIRIEATFTRDLFLAEFDASRAESQAYLDSVVARIEAAAEKRRK